MLLHEALHATIVIRVVVSIVLRKKKPEMREMAVVKTVWPTYFIKIIEFH